MIKTSIACLAARTVRAALRMMGKGATTLPGKIALKIDPDIISRKAEGKNIITVTGTNGKTTTAHMISDMISSMGINVINNISGANLQTGVATTLVCEKGRGDDMYVLEVDEAAFAKIAGSLGPKVCVVTNLFRDQLDRYGELTHTRDLIASGIAKTGAKVILNADDSLVASIGDGIEDRCVFFGMDKVSMKENNEKYPPRKGVIPASPDAVFCPVCKVRYEYRAHSFGHLGDFYCPTCGFKSPHSRFEVIYDLGTSPSNDDYEYKIRDSLSGTTVDMKQKVPGTHNLYNTCAAISAVTVFTEALKGREGDADLFRSSCASQDHVSAAFGRMEKIDIDGKKLCIFLVKNPIGLDRALTFIADSNDKASLMMLLSSNFADGKDVSWIWDVDFESKAEDLPSNIAVSGQRYADMKLRLEYAGAKVGRSGPNDKAIEILRELINECPQGGCVYVLPTYTAMLSLRAGLVRELGLKEFWK